MALHHYEFGRGHDPPAAGSRRGQISTRAMEGVQAHRPRREEESGRSDAPRYPIWGFDRIYSFRSERRKGLNARPSYKKVCRKD